MSTNQSPVANSDVLELAENTPLVVLHDDLLLNDTDPDGDALFITGVGNAVNVTVALTADGDISIMPAPNYSGPASFTYTISDGRGGTSTATVDITVSAENGNTPPLAVSDSVATDEDTPLVLAPADLLANDADANGDVLTITSVGDAVNGTVSIDGSGNVVFTPAANYNGPASFTYTVDDGQGGTATATVNVDVVAVNDAPVATADAVVANEDTPLVIAPAALLGNDSDADGDILQITSVGDAVNGTVSLDGGGNVVFTPAANYNGPASFAYTVSDGQGGSATATVNINVSGTNDMPVANPDSVEIAANTPMTFAAEDLLGNDTDPDGDTLSIVSVGDASHGTVTRGPDGDITFTPAPDYSGPASFTYTVSDGQGGQATTTVSIDVQADSGPAPEVSVTPASGAEDTAIPLCIDCTLPGGASAQGVSILISGVPAGATLSAGTDLGGGAWSLDTGQLAGLKLTPPKNSGADFALTVTATTDGGSTSAQLPVAVAAVADAPTLSATTPTAATTQGMVLNGGQRGDHLFGGAGSDTVSGGSGDDLIVGDSRFRMAAAPLNIKAALTDLDGSETLTVTVAGLPFDAALSAGTPNADGSWTLTADQLAGLEVLFPPGAHAFTLSITATATDHDSDNGSVDTESVSATVQVPTMPEGNDVLHGGDGNDEIRGTGGNDTITGDSGNDFLSGDLGNDSMTGDSGNDTIFGRSGDDNLSGGSGADRLHGDDGNDRLSGGDDNDRLNGDSGNDTLSGDKGNDSLFGGDGKDSLSGGDGDDRLNGDSGSDTLSGDSGRDQLAGGDGNDSLSGGDGDDGLLGGGGNDLLSGGGGQDWIEGGRGADTLSGGAGHDRFVFNSGREGADVITDFGKGDIIDIQDVLHGKVDDGQDAVAGGFVRFLQSGADTLVQIDANGGANGFETLAVLKNVSASTLQPDDVLAV